MTGHFYKFKKRINSTKRPDPDDAHDIDMVLKDSCSISAPVFRINNTANTFAWTYLTWTYSGNVYYYFIDDIVLLNNKLIEIRCTLDVLATYKEQIESTTAFVAYADSDAGSIWLPDTRIPMTSQIHTEKNSVSFDWITPNTGDYILAALGDAGCVLYATTLSNLKIMIENTSSWVDSAATSFRNRMGQAVTAEEIAQIAAEITLDTDLLGNAYANAPNCIRSCHWMPMHYSSTGTGSQAIKLGRFTTGAVGIVIDSKPVTHTNTIAIPWHYNDWRRTAEHVYLYLPFVGMISIPTSEILNISSITIDTSVTFSDGNMVYEVKAGTNEILGTYPCNVAASYAIGLNQSSSLGDIFSTMMNGAEQTVCQALTTANVLPGANEAEQAVKLAIGAANSAYKTADVALSTHPSCVGSFGGGAGCGIDTNAICFTVYHPYSEDPDDVSAIIGKPLMMIKRLDTLSGYVQCASAHVAGDVLLTHTNAVDSYLNTGFYLE